MSTQDNPNSVSGAQSKATTQNPKDLFGLLKVSLTKLPAVAVAHGAHAMMDGAEKYGPYNWRDKHVLAGIYCDAAMRHIQAWFEGERDAQDSHVHHLGHAIACCAILLDAEANGALIDDRPGKRTSDVLAQAHALISEKIQYRRKEKEQARVDKTWVDAACAEHPKSGSNHFTYQRVFSNEFNIVSPRGIVVAMVQSEEAAMKTCRELDYKESLGAQAKQEVTVPSCAHPNGYHYLVTADGRFAIFCPDYSLYKHVSTEDLARIMCAELNRNADWAVQAKERMERAKTGEQKRTEATRPVGWTYVPLPSGKFAIANPQGNFCEFVNKEDTAKIVCAERNARA